MHVRKSCMKQKTYTTNNLDASYSTATMEDAPSITPVDIEDELDAWLNAIHLPDAEPDQHFHVDFGFVRGSDFRLKVKSRRTLMSVDC